MNQFSDLINSKEVLKNPFVGTSKKREVKISFVGHFGFYCYYELLGPLNENANLISLECTAFDFQQN